MESKRGTVCGLLYRPSSMRRLGQSARSSPTERYGIFVNLNVFQIVFDRRLEQVWVSTQHKNLEGKLDVPPLPPHTQVYAAKQPCSQAATQPPSTQPPPTQPPPTQPRAHTAFVLSVVVKTTSTVGQRRGGVRPFSPDALKAEHYEEEHLNQPCKGREDWADDRSRYA